MSIETVDQICSRLLLRELGYRIPPLPHNSSLTALDVEDAFLEDLAEETKPVAKPESKPMFDSEPE